MKAFVIAGGLPQIELIKQLKARGITTVMADGNNNALAKPYADVFYQKRFLHEKEQRIRYLAGEDIEILDAEVIEVSDTE